MPLNKYLWYGIFLFIIDKFGLAFNQIIYSSSIRVSGTKRKNAKNCTWSADIFSPNQVFRAIKGILVKKKKPCRQRSAGQIKFGGDILSRFNPVPSAQAGLTSLFGMGRGGPRRYSHQKALNILVFL